MPLDLENANMDKKLEKDQTEPLLDLENVEIQPLSDEDLESVSGGFCSVWCCS
jgi:hypothetical protein